MPRPRLMPLAFLLGVVLVAAACSSPAASSPADESIQPGGGSESDAPAPSASAAADNDVPAAGTDLNACEIVTAGDVEAALDLPADTVAEGAMRESPNVLSPGHTDCVYEGDWGRVTLSLTPEDGANLYDAAVNSYPDPDAQRDVTGADGAFWSETNGRFFVWKGAVTLLVQISFIASGGDVEQASQELAQAAIDKVA